MQDYKSLHVAAMSSAASDTDTHVYDGPWYRLMSSILDGLKSEINQPMTNVT